MRFTVTKTERPLPYMILDSQRVLDPEVVSFLVKSDADKVAAKLNNLCKDLNGPFAWKNLKL